VFRAIHGDYGVPVAIRHPCPSTASARACGDRIIRLTLDTVKSPNQSLMRDSGGGPGSYFPNMADPPCCRLSPGEGVPSGYRRTTPRVKGIFFPLCRRNRAPPSRARRACRRCRTSPARG
jgi:hypothetical protein